LPAAAVADVRAGSATDAAGDGDVPARDVTSAEVTYDTQGSIVSTVTLRAAPDAGNAVAIATGFGQWTNGRCGLQVIADAVLPSGAHQWRNVASGELFPTRPTVTVSGTTVTLQAADRRVWSQPWDCADVTTALSPSDVEAKDKVAPFDLRTIAVTPPPPPPPPPAPPPAAKPPAAKPKQSKRLRRAIKRCQRRYKGSRRSVKRARTRCISRARKKYGGRRG
jgi:hypothetical protein